ncbi:Riboflavin biosynthesis protein RibD [Poriferisphaera corsica]|uniref:Riboflavin biosynthesis protein RibD n=1 Tax=Poriferisphaera corsica TaxID=2528020 RepID=A0A517YZ24_9BACT|nr:bifunctional diaminohydroxyphosphoribosylaminopyrimidine deaminase/5-amino-6-(5-phosphoribosylamino)uracil reductase RibD [Poriferisphaera corsica]QDU35475.1 Riboflavin biosynthesis protein RibD [Poriferisphaera corsica]
MSRLQPRDVTFMRHALDLAMQGRGYVEPNPMVGAVIVRDNSVVGSGYHQKYGDAHAEVEAIKDAHEKGVDVKGLTMYVNLEPCCHHGKQGPCADAVIEAGLGRVVVAMEDPYEEVSGAGIEKLVKAGIEVTVGVCEEQALKLNEAFVKRVESGLPWVMCKWAQTVDGKTATTTGDSKWISCDRSREIVHRIRGRFDGVMVGVRTVEMDDPVLTARGVVVKRVARRIVIDPNLRLPLNCKLLKEDGPEVLIAACGKVAGEERERVKDIESFGAKVVPVTRREDGRLDMCAFMRLLVKDYGMTNILCEGGANLTGSLFADELVDQVLVFVSPRIAGDQDAMSAVHGHNLHHICDTHQLQLDNVKQIMDDVLIDYRVIHPNGPEHRVL